MESKVENSTKGPESADKCESNTYIPMANFSQFTRASKM
jgi:hypothetical protein